MDHVYSVHIRQPSHYPNPQIH